VTDINKKIYINLILIQSDITFIQSDRYSINSKCIWPTLIIIIISSNQK